NEILDGTNPYDAKSFVRRAIAIRVLNGAVAFTTPGTGSLVAVGTLINLPPGFNPDQAQVKVNVGGVVTAFILNKTGRGKNDSASIAISPRKVRDRATGEFVYPGGDTPFRLTLQKGPYLDLWAALGVDPAATKFAVPFEMPVE